MAWISLIKWGSVIFFSHIIGFKDKLSLACTQQVCIYVWGEDLLSSSIALCRYKQEKKETWSRQKWIITTSDKHIQTAKSVGWTLARGTLISTRWHHLRAAATLFFRCLGLRYSCRLFWTLFFHTSPGYQKSSKSKQTPCERPPTQTGLSKCSHLTSFTVIESFSRLHPEETGTLAFALMFAIAPCDGVRDGWGTFPTLHLSDRLATWPPPVLLFIFI